MGETLRRQREHQHRCHATRCPTPVPPSRLMCTKHWGMVPYQVQKVYWAHRPKSGMEGVPSSLYLEAVADAIEAVRKTEEDRRGG